MGSPINSRCSGLQRKARFLLPWNNRRDQASGDGGDNQRLFLLILAIMALVLLWLSQVGSI